MEEDRRQGGDRRQGEDRRKNNIEEVIMQGAELKDKRPVTMKMWKCILIGIVIIALITVLIIGSIKIIQNSEDNATEVEQYEGEYEEEYEEEYNQDEEEEEFVDEIEENVIEDETEENNTIENETPAEDLDDGQDIEDDEEPFDENTVPLDEDTPLE